MNRILLKSKIHRATITDRSVDYIGSITIDENLMKLADMVEYEKVLVADLNNGNRFETYVIKGKPGSGEICINGAAAHLCNTGDLVIIMSFGIYEDNTEISPAVVFVDEKNNPKNL